MTAYSEERCSRCWMLIEPDDDGFLRCRSPKAEEAAWCNQTPRIRSAPETDDPGPIEITRKEQTARGEHCSRCLMPIGADNDGFWRCRSPENDDVTACPLASSYLLAERTQAQRDQVFTPETLSNFLGCFTATGVKRSFCSPPDDPGPIEVRSRARRDYTIQPLPCGTSALSALYRCICDPELIRHEQTAKRAFEAQVSVYQQLSVAAKNLQVEIGTQLLIAMRRTGFQSHSPPPPKAIPSPSVPQNVLSARGPRTEQTRARPLWMNEHERRLEDAISALDDFLDAQGCEHDRFTPAPPDVSIPACYVPPVSSMPSTFAPRRPADYRHALCSSLVLATLMMGSGAMLLAAGMFHDLGAILFMIGLITLIMPNMVKL